MTDSLSAPERETIVTMNDEDDYADIWTAQRPVITRLKKNPSATLTEEGKHGTTVWARFTLPADLITFRSTRRTRELSEEERAEFAARMKAARSGARAACQDRRFARKRRVRAERRFSAAAKRRPVGCCERPAT
jgi:hypothetical protein